MNAIFDQGDPGDVEAVLRQDLAQGDAMLGTIKPILRHLIANDEHSVFGDEIIASMRGMLSDIARQLIDAFRAAGEDQDHDPADRDAVAETLIQHLANNPALLGHVHGLALETQLTNRMQARLAIDPVLSPLLQALVASEDPQVAAAAMALLAAQARFVQQQRRMELPLKELPGDLLHNALLACRAEIGQDAEQQAQFAAAERSIRTGFDEGRSRLGLMARMLASMGGGATAALSVSHAGVAIFLSALAIASGQDRDLAILATNETQVARLALALRSAGLKPAAIGEQFEALHPDIILPAHLETLGSDGAAALLARSTAFAGG